MECNGKVLKREELCRLNQDWSNAKATDILPFYLVPRKIELSYCRNCDDRITDKGEYYCLAKKTE